MLDLIIYDKLSFRWITNPSFNVQWKVFLVVVLFSIKHIVYGIILFTHNKTIFEKTNKEIFLKIFQNKNICKNHMHRFFKTISGMIQRICLHKIELLKLNINCIKFTLILFFNELFEINCVIKLHLFCQIQKFHNSLKKILCNNAISFCMSTNIFLMYVISLIFD